MLKYLCMERQGVHSSASVPMECTIGASVPMDAHCTLYPAAASMNEELFQHPPKKRGAPPYREDMEPTRERIIRAAADLFGKKGFHAVTVREIASRLDITAGALYNHFATKEDIREAAYGAFVSLLPDYDLWMEEVREDSALKDLGLEAALMRYIGRVGTRLNATLGSFFRFVSIERFSDLRAASVYHEFLEVKPADFFEALLHAVLDDGPVAIPCRESAYLFNRALLSASFEVFRLREEGRTDSESVLPVIETVKTFTALVLK